MITVRPFEPADLMQMNIQKWQRQPEFEVTPEYCQFLADNSYEAKTILAGEKVVSVGGVIDIWRGRSEIWTLLDQDCGRWMKAIHRISRAFIDAHSERVSRLETCCEVEWPQAHRWLGLLGFEHERLARKYMPSGRDVDIYVRIK